MPEATPAPTGDPKAPPAVPPAPATPPAPAPAKPGATPPVDPKAPPAAPGGAPEPTTLATGAEPKGSDGDLVLKLPEGRELNATLLDGFKSWAKEHKVAGEAAQKLVDTFVKDVETQEKEVNDVRASWLEAARTDKEIGGEHLKETMTLAQKAMVQFGTDSLKTFLNETHLGNHPEVVRLLAKVGKAISEDTFRGTAAAGSRAGELTPKEKEEAKLKAMYPKMYAKK